MRITLSLSAGCWENAKIAYSGFAEYGYTASVFLWCFFHGLAFALIWQAPRFEYINIAQGTSPISVLIRPKIDPAVFGIAV